MWENYLKIGWRVLKKNRLYTVLNVLGLTMGISGFLMNDFGFGSNEF